jgi:hypothetical protein
MLERGVDVVCAVAGAVCAQILGDEGGQGSVAWEAERELNVSKTVRDYGLVPDAGWMGQDGETGGEDSSLDNNVSLWVEHSKHS